MLEYNENILLLHNIIMGAGQGKVVHVPMFSMRSYETNKYDLTCDGNMNRLVSVWINVIKTYLRGPKTEKLDIRVIIPSLDDLTPQSVDFLKKIEDEAGGYLTFMYEFGYPSGGPKVIRSLNGTLELNHNLDKFLQKLEGKKVVVYEPEYVGTFVEGLKKSFNEYDYRSMTTVFWCPVSDTESTKPSFLENVRYVDRELANACDCLMVATSNQVKYFSSYNTRNLVILMDMLIDPSLPIFSFKEDKEMKDSIDKYEADGKHVIYFPFRLSDPGYRFKDVLKCLEDINSLYPIVLLYTDPNDTAKDLIPKGSNLELVKVSSNRDTYYTCISDKRCIIPYFEDVADIMHASWQEMEFYKSSVVSWDLVGGLRDEKHMHQLLVDAIENS